ncbi:MAG: hypothetical protein IIB66_05095 [Proteobacteria bacterium]|nr:hypothetical protein [Pseudomonadota bacterium]MCH8188070.1 hypothetical protein [Pseudomonadota bacterium]
MTTAKSKQGETKFLDPGGAADYPDMDMRLENNVERKRFTNKRGEPLGGES